MATTIMHVSDLHRDSESRVTTKTLLSSLQRDFGRYTQNEGIPKPDLAVVSGDIVYGVKSTDPNGVQKLEAQYNEAFETLVSLADRFFEGDRERVIIVPGNHDVSMLHVDRSLRKMEIPPDVGKRKLLARQLNEPASIYRFNLEDFALLEIENTELYDQRLEPYSKFYERFYNGKRKFSMNPERQFAVHDFPSLGICIVGLSSCHENDLYNRTGQIHVEAITQAMDSIVPFAKSGRLIISAWHHSIQGGPKDTDYIDSGFLRHLMDSNCSIGLHGHQHRPQLLEHRFSADSQRKISIISAGTLCGGPHSLPTGRMRAYNLIVLDLELSIGTIHVRTMNNDDFSSPIWDKGHVTEFGGSSMKFELIKPDIPKATPFELAEQADRLIREGKPQEAYDAVSDHMSDLWVKKVALDALVELRDWKTLISILPNPNSVSDFLLLCEAYEETNNWDGLRSLVMSDFAKGTKELAIQQKVEMCKAKLRGK